MPVGPSLRQRHAHQAIHAGGLAGALSKTEEVEGLFASGDLEMADQATEELLEYWESRILSHADAEEDGFYQEVVEKYSALQETVLQLKRDHELMRIVVKNIRHLRETSGFSKVILHKLYALLEINEIHSQEEERLLF
ncbi:hemerythrin domain-containing protein [Paenibacillus sp. MBLB2552]|uniref:Hemerythrin domain-containing protein n=1 Tax=Paenibacillus mellifer TaxID=2937794 RepID=A0A9X1Y0N0_9BACL|nr:hemerythrin domain-containing protein [Paenibacillus mellifer]MCK8489370.1 hemerythrin domain-containing protein [Paenibacillus mellifer]